MRSILIKNEKSQGIDVKLLKEIQEKGYTLPYFVGGVEQGCLLYVLRLTTITLEELYEWSERQSCWQCFSQGITWLSDMFLA